MPARMVVFVPNHVRITPALRRLAVGLLPFRGGAPGTAQMRRLILARPDGYRPADSNLELRFEKVLAEAGEALFERQVVVGDDDGRVQPGRAAGG